MRKVPRHIWRIRRKYLSVYGEYGEFRVVCGTKNHLRIQRIRGKNLYIHVPEIIDPVFTKTRPKRSFCMTENEHFGLVFTKTGFINGQWRKRKETLGVFS